MNRFFTHKYNIQDDIAAIVGEDVKHIKNVLRLDEGDYIIVCDCEGSDYKVKITKVENDKVVGIVEESYKSKGEPPIDIILYQGIPKSNKMELIIQKAVELGVAEIQPVIMDRTVVKIKDKNKENKKLDRWNKIALEASKQSHRGKIPKVNNVITFDEMTRDLKGSNNILVPYEGEKDFNLKTVLSNYSEKTIRIVIGPEGGFDEGEIKILKNINADIVTLGPRILRTETAGFTTIAIVMYELGDLGVI